MGVTTRIRPRRGDRYTLVVRPLEWYAGRTGVGAVVEAVSDAAVYVLFDGGLRECYPPARFSEYFSPEDAAPPARVLNGEGAETGVARAALRDLLHR